jgi:hypothetical protein
MKTMSVRLSPSLVVAAASVVTMAIPLVAAQTAAPKSQAAPAARSAKAYAPPRTAWGDPDLSGSYTNTSESGTPFERPAEFEGKRLDEITPAELAKAIDQRNNQKVVRAPTLGGAETGAGPTHWFEDYNAKNTRPWMVTDPPDGKIPPTTEEAKQRAALAVARRRGGDSYSVGPFDGPEDLTLYVRCISRGLPGSMMPAIYGNSYQIVQGPGYVGIRYEMVHETRIIPLDGRSHVGGNVQLDMGDARGHFEGDTLVVETTNFTERSAFRGASRYLKLTERFKPMGPKTIEWSVTADDPHTWTRPWTFAMTLTHDEAQPVFEYACHEGNHGLHDILSGARADEAAAAARAAAQVAR